MDEQVFRALLEEFYLESKERLDHIEQVLLAVEAAGPEQRAELLVDAKRELHTLKGEARLLENLLHYEDGVAVTRDDIAALASWDAKNVGEREIAFRTARVLLQDFTGVPCVVDLAAMRDAIIDLGGKPEMINPLQTSELVIDHSVQVDEFGTRRYPLWFFVAATAFGRAVLRSLPNAEWMR